MQRSPWIACAVAMVATLSTAVPSPPPAIAGPAITSGTATVRSIEGTTWAGTDSDGDFYEYTFLKQGQLRFRTKVDGEFKTYEDPGDEWAQNGPIVIIVTSKFATWQGRMVNGTLQGDAWNVEGRRWTWSAEPQGAMKKE